MQNFSGLRSLAALTAALLLPASLAAQPATGAVEGRVFNSATGAALGRAQIAVEGGTRETSTDSDGLFRLAGVPAGAVRLNVSYVGFARQSIAVTVPPGGTVQRDVELNLAGARPASATEAVVKLQAFNVVADREMSAQAISMNEQRYSPNIKNVVAIDEYGDRGDENIGEFLRFLPGVSLNDSGLVPNEVTLRGFPASTSGVTIDGGDVMGARGGDTRALSLLEGISSC